MKTIFIKSLKFNTKAILVLVLDSSKAITPTNFQKR